MEPINVTFNELSRIESACMRCHNKGETKMLFTNIPFYKEVLISSFECPHCHYTNKEIQTVSEIKNTGINYNLKITSKSDLQRDVVRSDFATIIIPELELEIPPSKKGKFNTIEGFLIDFKEDLEIDQPERAKVNMELKEKIDEFLKKLESFISANDECLPFHFIIDDPSGNSFVKNPFAPLPDNNLIIKNYHRTPEQLKQMGYLPENNYKDNNADINKTENIPENVKLEMDKFKEEVTNNSSKGKKIDQNAEQLFHKFENIKTLGFHKLDYSKPIEPIDIESQTVQIPDNCYTCGAPGIFKMCTCSIPYFKEIIIMAYTCDYCGYRTSEVKTGGGLSEKAKRITIKVNKEDDLNRDIFKSDTVRIHIPEIGLSLSPYTLGSLYTTVEGLLEKIIEGLSENNPFVGDSSDTCYNEKFQQFLKQLEDLKSATIPFTLILDDPLDNCFAYNPFYPNEDPDVTVEVYERTKEQNDELGISDMVV